MRKIRCFTLIGCLAMGTAFTLTSCDEDSEYVYMNEHWVERATVIPSENNDLTLQTDGGRNLTVVSNYTGYNAQQEYQRAFIKYTLLDKNEETGVYKANLYGVENILTKNIVELTTDNEKEIGNDPVHLYHVWCAGGYLNVNFGFNYGGTVTHTVNVVKNTIETHPDDGKIYLEFRHNAFGDPQNVAHLGTACFDLRPYALEEGRVVTFVIKFNEFGSESSYEIKYDFRTDNATPQESNNYLGGLGYE